jgi:Kef-type K+ transport system membrane component KefB
VFALFLCVAMSITAFPVLARILTEYGMAATPLGRMALTCAAVDDVKAWSLLAAVTALAAVHGRWNVGAMIALVVVFSVFMVAIVQPLLRRFRIGEPGLILLLFASAAVTEIIGIHSVFGRS